MRWRRKVRGHEAPRLALEASLGWKSAQARIAERKLACMVHRALFSVKPARAVDAWRFDEQSASM
jgi:hypothetical protein